MYMQYIDTHRVNHMGKEPAKSGTPQSGTPQIVLHILMVWVLLTVLYIKLGVYSLYLHCDTCSISTAAIELVLTNAMQ